MFMSNKDYYYLNSALMKQLRLNHQNQLQTTRGKQLRRSAFHTLDKR